MQGSEGILARTESIRIGTMMVAVQFMLVSWTVAAMYRLMVYTVDIKHDDSSEMLDIHNLWTMVQFATKYSVHGLSNYTQDSAQSRLSNILRVYDFVAQPPVRIHSGIFRPRFIVAPELDDFLYDSVVRAFPIEIGITTLDHIILIYSIFVLVLSLLYHSLDSKRKDTNSFDVHVVISADMLQGDVLVYDILFWVLCAMTTFIVLEILSPVSYFWLFFFVSIVYAFLMYIPTTPGVPPHLARIAFVKWLIVVISTKILSTADIFTTIVSVLLDIVAAMFVYVHLFEPAPTLIKFLNARYWTAILFSMFIVFLYFSQVEYVSQTQHIHRPMPRPGPP
jgi:hypothetical protein